MRRLLLGAALALIFLPAAWTAAPARAGVADYFSPNLTNLRVVSEAPWQADELFELSWSQPTQPSFPIEAVEYQLYDEAGNPVGPARRNSERVGGLWLTVPGPGIYRAEVWLRDSIGPGSRSSTFLRYDATAPGAPTAVAPSRWIAGDEPARLRIEEPPSPLPRSGIRGYAISLDDGGDSSPCAHPGHCTIAETDVASGGEEISLGRLPEGLTVARVAAVSGAGVPSVVVPAYIHVDATRPELRLAGAPSGWASGPVRVQALAEDSLSGMSASGAFTAIAVDGAAPTVAPGARASAVVAGSGAHRVSLFARDAAGNVADGNGAAPGPEAATVRIDEDPPRVEFATRQDPAEPERLEATVTDDLSGPSASHGSIAVRQVGGKGPFLDLPTGVSEGKLTAHWDSDGFPPGKYEFRAIGYDGAGNQTTGTRRSRGGRMVLVNPLKTEVALESGFGGRRMVWQRCRRSGRGGRHCRRRSLQRYDARPATRSITYGHGIRFGGRLRSPTGATLAGLEVTITETFEEGSTAARRITYARTGGDGTYSGWLAPGPGREVVASFGGSKLLSRASGRTVRLGVLGSVHLRASSPAAKIGGPPVVFSGRVDRRDAEFPEEGRSVELQFRYPGSDWSEFRTVQTDAHGRFRLPYTFSDDDSRGVRFRFRAYLREQARWPYEPAYSRQVAVTGR